MAAHSDTLQPQGAFRSPTTATILVVDDEAAVCKLAGKILRGGGYVVLEAQNGQEALDIGRDWHGAIDLLLTDVMMPGMGGPQLAQQLTIGRADLRVAFMSGLINDTDEPLQRERLPFLGKPFTATDLVALVRDVLQQ